MFVYLALNRLFPNSFTAKVFFIAFLCTHIPLIAATAYLFWRTGGIAGNMQLAVLLLGATLVGTAITLLSLHAILRPLYRVGAAMRRFEQERQRTPLPDTLNDELGELMRLTNRLVLGVDAELRESHVAATTDPLTGAFNRRGFMQKLANAPFHGGAVLYVDLDHFKLVNDRFGHDVGDAVLLATADTLRNALRHQDLFARFGGEEFVIFLPGKSTSDAARIAERLRQAIAAEVRAGTEPVTTSIGVARLDHPDHLQNAMSCPDDALYRAKAAGRNRIELAA
jgi:diguanylate cyclase (GGDEF)-like protein